MSDIHDKLEEVLARIRKVELEPEEAVLLLNLCRMDFFLRLHWCIENGGQGLGDEVLTKGEVKEHHENLVLLEMAFRPIIMGVGTTLLTTDMFINYMCECLISPTFNDSTLMNTDRRAGLIYQVLQKLKEPLLVKLRDAQHEVKSDEPTFTQFSKDPVKA